MIASIDTNQTQLKNEELLFLEIRIKQLQGSDLTTREAACIARWDKRYRESIRSDLLRELPKGVFCDLAGRQRKSVDEFAANYRIPVDGPTINLYAVINSLLTRVSELAAIARKHDDVDEIELEREKLKQEIVKLRRQSEILDIDIKMRMNQLVSREDVAVRLSWLSGQLQALGSRLHRVGGPESQLALNEFLENLAVELDGGSLSL